MRAREAKRLRYRDATFTKWPEKAARRSLDDGCKALLEYLRTNEVTTLDDMRKALRYADLDDLYCYGVTVWMAGVAGEPGNLVIPPLPRNLQ